MTEIAGNRIIEFKEEGVKVILPPGLDHVFVKRMKDIDAPDEVDNFKPNRHAIRVLFLDCGQSDDELQDFGDHSITLRVNYNQDDLDHADDKEVPNPVLGIHDGKKWHFPGEKGKVKFKRIPKDSHPRWIGFGEVSLTSWADPLISWGP